MTGQDEVKVHPAESVPLPVLAQPLPPLYNNGNHNTDQQAYSSTAGTSTGTGSNSNTAIQPQPYWPTYAPTQTVVNVPAVPSPLASYRRRPVRVTCHACGSVVDTTTTPKMGVAIAGSIFALIFFGCYLGCCLIPLCVRDMYDTVHSCPNCKTQVGVYKVIKF